MSGDQDEDPWGFLTEGRPRRQPAPQPSAPAEGERVSATPGVTSGRLHDRERGELRATITPVSLRRRAWPVALALALVSLAGFATEIVATAQVISLAGPKSMIVVYPLGGIGLVLLALAQFRYIDGKARLPMIRIVSLIYGIAFAVTLGMLAGSIAPVVAAAALWLLADQLNFLLPLMIWSLAGDEFNVAEGRKIFGWIVSWTYAGQVAGLLLSTAAAPAMDSLGIPLPWLLVIGPVICVVVAWWLPRAMRNSAAAKGLARQENLGESLRSAWDFINGIPVWRYFLLASSITFVAGMMTFIAFLTGADAVLGRDAATLQFVYGVVSLVSFLLCWLLQVFAASAIQEKFGIPGTLLILPIATVAAAVALTAGILADSMALLVIGMGLWLIPRWSVDENARRAAFALVPDERRTRVSFFVDLGPVALGLIIAGPMAAIGLLTGQAWLVPAIAGVLALLAIPPSVKMLRGWDDSLLNWRLRRRKRNRSINLGDADGGI